MQKRAVWVSLFGLMSCVNSVATNDELILAVQPIDSGAVIIGNVDWVEASSLPDGSEARRNSRAVGFLYLPTPGSRCTASLITPNVVMTNQHCVPTAASAVGAEMYFGYEGSDATFIDGYVCDGFLGNDASLDFALLQCQNGADGRSPGERFGVLGLEDRRFVRDAAVYLLHQNCDYFGDANCTPSKKMSPGTTIGLVDDGQWQHNADSLGGSSGGPLMSSSSHAVVALHHVGVNQDARGRGSYNLAVPMTQIVPVLRARFPGLALGARLPQGALTCEAIPGGGATLEEDGPCVTLGGPTQYLRASTEGSDGGLVWTGATSSANAGNSASYALNFSSAGRYRVEAYTDTTVATSRQAAYRIVHGGVTDRVVVNQASADGFRDLGTFAFAAGGNQTISIADNTGEGSNLRRQVVFDAIRLTAVVDAPPPQPAPCSRLQTTSTTPLNVRPTAATGNTPLGQVQPGAVVDRLATVTGTLVRGTTDWYRIRSGTLEGFITASYAVCVP